MATSLRRKACAVVLCALALSSLGCMKKQPKGELVGAYAISGALMENTCGQSALPTASPLTYKVEIRDADGVGMWALEKKSAQAGDLDETGAFLFQVEVNTPLGLQAQPKKVLEPGDFLSGEADPDLNKANCTLVRRETMRGTLHRRLADVADGGSMQMAMDAGADAGTATADLTGENTIEVAPAVGSDCSLQLASAGGAYLALPCRVLYELEGTLED